MIIHKIPVGPLATNCYILADDKTKEAIIIDPGDEAEKILDVVEKNSLKPKSIVLTHAHFDHIGALKAIKNVTSLQDVTLKEGDEIKLGKTKLKIIETPGHTPDGICVIAEDCIFTGDTLFKNSIGRTDLEGGDNDQIRKSLKRLMDLPDDYKIYPGHGPNSTIALERQNNPFLKF